MIPVCEGEISSFDESLLLFSILGSKTARQMLPRLLACTWSHVMSYGQWTTSKWLVSFLVSEILSNPSVLFFHVTKTLQEKRGDGEAVRCLSHHLTEEPNIGELLDHSRFCSERLHHLPKFTQLVN